MDSISDINPDEAYQAIYDPNVEANWMELQV